MGIEAKSINPLLGITVGSTVLGNDFKPSVLISPITRMITQKEIEMGMSGKSQYVYTDSLNEGTIGFSGAYGPSGIAKFTSAVAVSVSNATASEYKSIKVSYNISMISGIEYIDFDNLTVEDVLNSLSAGPKNLSLKVLEKFIAARDCTGSSTEKDELMKEWVKSLQNFISSYGDGLVVGAIWGGMGSVSTEMTSKKSEDSWKYGETAEFSYSGIGSSVSIAQTYNGSQKDQSSEVEVSCKALASGGCVESQVNSWFDVVANKSFAEISGISLLDKAPMQSSVSPPPKIPDFLKPEKNEEVTEKLDTIKKLGDSEEFSLASGYEEAKKTNPNLTFEEFKSTVRDKNNIDGLNDLASKVQENSLDVLAEGSVSRRKKNISLQGVRASSLDSSSDYAVLGAWIANWSDIFPWMSMGYMNEINDAEVAEYILKIRCMMQDLSTLNTIYNTFNACNIKLDFCHLNSASQVADSFKIAQGVLSDNVESDDAVEIAFNSLSDEAKKIYTAWNEIGFLRNAELGLGLLIGDQSVSSEIIDVKPIPYPEVTYKAAYCSYGGNNPTAFSSFIKMLPFIDTNGDIYAFGPSLMLLRKALPEKMIFTKGGEMAMKLTADKGKGILTNDSVRLIPIPYSAAKGVQWRGQGQGRSLASSQSLQDQFAALEKELGNLNICTLSSDSWSKDWTYTVPYTLRKISTTYIGTVEKINSIFG